MTIETFNESVVLAIRAMMRRNEQSKAEVLDEACDSQGIHWQQGSDREWKATGYCCANCLEIDKRIKNENPFI